VSLAEASLSQPVSSRKLSSNGILEEVKQRIPSLIARTSIVCQRCAEFIPAIRATVGQNRRLTVGQPFITFEMVSVLTVLL